MSLHKILLIARRDFLTNVRRRSYLFTAFVIPILSIGFSIFATTLSNSQLDSTGDFARVGIVDQVNILTGLTLKKPYEVLTLAQAEADVKAGTLQVYFVLPPDYLAKKQALSFSTVSLPPGLDADFNKQLRAAFTAQTGSQDVIARLQDPTGTLVIRQLDNPQKFDETVLFGSFFVPYIFGILLFASIMTTSQFLMSGVVEEKENRMMEVLATSSRPSEMLWGKIIGLGGLGLLQLLIWGLVGAFFVLTRADQNVGATLAGLQLTPASLVLFLAYFLLGYLFNGAIMAGIGASVNAESESRQIATIMSLIYLLPFFFTFTFVSDPDGSLQVFLSLFPFTSPVSMLMRRAFTDVPTSQVLLSLALLAASAFLIVWVSGRVFRLGMLSYGKRLGLRDIVRAIRDSRAVASLPKEA